MLKVRHVLKGMQYFNDVGLETATVKAVQHHSMSLCECFYTSIAVSTLEVVPI